MDTQQCFGFLLVQLLNMEHLIGMVSITHLFKVRLFIKGLGLPLTEAFQEFTMKVRCLTVLMIFFTQSLHISVMKKVVMKVQSMVLMWLPYISLLTIPLWNSPLAWPMWSRIKTFIQLELTSNQTYPVKFTSRINKGSHVWPAFEILAIT